jgi:DNA-binding ferritin-like protein
MSSPFDLDPEHPGVSSSATPPDDATFVIWQDPSSYNPLFHGPPYLPGMKVRMDKAASLKTAGTIASKLAHGSGTGLPTALVFLRALTMIHQGHHWLTFGESYYADHLLFERLYDETLEEVDAVAEKAIGVGCPKDKIHPGLQATFITKVVQLFCGDGQNESMAGDPKSYLEASLKAEELLLSSLAAIAAEMKENGELTRGVDNLLAGIEDKHEGHVYLLKQRLTPDPWKV